MNGEKLSPVELLNRLNKIGGENGIGRADLVETRLVGMKSHGVYETPGGTILFRALRELEMITMDFDTLSMKNTMALKYADIVYAGKWFTHFRESMDAYMAKAMQYATGSVKLTLYKGNVIITGRKSPYSLYLEDLASFGESTYDHKDATGFINLYGLATGVAAIVHKNLSSDEGPAQEMKEMAFSMRNDQPPPESAALNIIVRRATVADVDAVFRLTAKMADRALMLRRSKYRIVSMLANFFVAVVPGDKGSETVVGCGALMPLWTDLGEIMSLAVDDEYRIRGIGKLIVESLIAEARRMLIPELISLTYQVGFFEKLGFARTDKDRFPRKLWRECLECPKLEHCDETAMHLPLQVNTQESPVSA